MSVRWILESDNGTELRNEPLAGERTFLDWWCHFGRRHGLVLIPSYLDRPGAMEHWSGVQLADLRNEVESLRVAWEQEPEIVDLPPDTMVMGGQQLLVHLRTRSKELLDAIDHAQTSGAVLWLW